MRPGKQRLAWCDHKSSKAGSHQNLEEARNRFPYKSSERAQSCQHLDFGSTKMILDFCLPGTVREKKFWSFK